MGDHFELGISCVPNSWYLFVSWGSCHPYYLDESNLSRRTSGRSAPKLSQTLSHVVAENASPSKKYSNTQATALSVVGKILSWPQERAGNCEWLAAIRNRVFFTYRNL